MSNEMVVDIKANVEKWERTRSLIANLYFGQTDLFDDIEIPVMYKEALNQALVAIDFRIEYWREGLDEEG